MAYEPIVQQLVDKMAAEPALKASLAASVDLAVHLTPEYNENGITTLDMYVEYMNDFVRWVPSETIDGTKVYVHICMFYFVLDLPPVRLYQNPIEPSQSAPWTWLSQWIIDYAKTMGLWMDDPASLTPSSLATFYASTQYHMRDYIVPDGGWTSFNDFFARHIKPEVRPIDAPTDDRVIVSPADCEFDGTWPVSTGDASITAKGIEWPISQLLEDAKLGGLFAGGVFTHSFLGPQDYHRFHAPVGGKVVATQVFPGLCYLEVVLLKDDTAKDGRKVKLGMRRVLSDEDVPEKDRAVPIAQVLDAGNAAPALPPKGMKAPDSTGYQFLQARGLVLIDNPLLGLVAVLPIGMAQVSSVCLTVSPTLTPTLTKGQEIGFFQMGGSDIVMVFQKGANVNFKQDILHKPYVFGSSIATGGSA